MNGLDLPDEPYVREQTAKFKIRIHLASGYTIETTSAFDDELEDEEVLRHLQSEVTLPRPAWVRIGHAVCFSQAVSAIEIEAY